MAWTAPFTWTVGLVLTAAKLNEQVRDNLLALSGHVHTGAAGDGSASLGPLVLADFTDAAAAAAPGAGKTRIYSVSGKPRFRAGVAGADTQIVVGGDTAGGELSGTYPNPSVVATHSGSAHHPQGHAMDSGTDHSAGTLGDVIYAAVAGAWARLTGNITTTRKFLRQTGTGAASAAPAWDTIADADVPATHSGSAHHSNANDHVNTQAGHNAWHGDVSPANHSSLALSGHTHSYSPVIALGFVIDGGGLAITTGIKGYLEIPFAVTLTGWTILGDQAGSIVVDVKRATYAGFPTTTSIASTDKPTLSAAQKNQNLTLTVWTVSLAAGDVLEFTVNSATTVQRVTVGLRGTRTVN